MSSVLERATWTVCCRCSTRSSQAQPGHLYRLQHLTDTQTLTRPDTDPQSWSVPPGLSLVVVQSRSSIRSSTRTSGAPSVASCDWTPRAPTPPRRPRAAEALPLAAAVDRQQGAEARTLVGSRLAPGPWASPPRKEPSDENLLLQIQTYRVKPHCCRENESVCCETLFYAVGLLGDTHQQLQVDNLSKRLL